MPSKSVVMGMRAAQNSRKRFSPPPSMFEGFPSSGALLSRLNRAASTKGHKHSFEEMPVLEEVASEC